MIRPKLSLVIPTYTITKELEEIAIRSVSSYVDHVDELIVCEDGGMLSYNLLQIADSYIYNKDNLGFSGNVNRGWRYAKGEYVAIVNSDTQLESGELYDLCVPGKVTSPHITNQHIERLAGPFWVAPREVTKERGYLLEDMRTYSSDSDYDHRIKDIFEKVPSVKIFHLQAQTVTAAGVEGGEEQERDRQIYQKLIEKGEASA